MTNPQNPGHEPESYGAGIGPFHPDDREYELFAPPNLRREGRSLFISLDSNNRISICTTIEALIDLMDSFEDDCDLEHEGDLEPMLGAPERHPRASGEYWRKDRVGDTTQARWAQGRGNEEEEPDVDDEEGHDAEGDGADTEPSLGWTLEIDQTKSGVGYQSSHEDEYNLGWCSHGIGYQTGEGLEEHEDEREGDPAENGIADQDAMDEMGEGGYPGNSLLRYDRSGTDSAVAMLRAAGLSMIDAEAFSPVSEPGTLFLRIAK